MSDYPLFRFIYYHLYSLGLFGRVLDYLFGNPHNLYLSHTRFTLLSSHTHHIIHWDSIVPESFKH